MCCPAAFPNLLVNGATGIAVGMATNMAPHNLGEVIAAARHLIANPDATLEDIMRFVPGPDLPTGGRIVGLDGIRDAYATGRGSFKTRAKVEVEQLSARRTGLVVTELPYMVGPEKVIEKIKDAVNGKKLAGHQRHRGPDRPQARPAPGHRAEERFQPERRARSSSTATRRWKIPSASTTSRWWTGSRRRWACWSCCTVYVDHRIDVVRRRTAFRLGKKKDRLHLVEGLLIAIVDIDEVIQIIRSSDEAAAARERLMSIYDLSEIQANYILELRLRQLTKYSRIELEKEQDELRREIAELEAILGSDHAAARTGLQRTGRGIARSTARRGGPCCSNPRPCPHRGTALPARRRRRPRARPRRSPARLRTTPAGPCSHASGQIARTVQPGAAWRKPARGSGTTCSCPWSRPRRGPRSPPSPRRAGCCGFQVHGHARAAAGGRLSRTWPAAFRPRSFITLAEGRNPGGVRAAGRGAGHRHRAGRGQARHPGLPAEPGRLGGHRAEGQGHRGGR